MEGPKSRLNKLLAKERATRTDTEESTEVNESRLDRSVRYHEVDTSPITTPENLADTRRRLSRMISARTVQKEKDTSLADVSFQKPRELFTSMISNTATRTIEPFRAGRNPNAFYAMSATTPIRARKRVTIQEREKKPEDLPQSQKLNRINRRPLSRARSLSPLPTRYNTADTSNYPQHDLHEMDINEEDESVFHLDFHTFQDADCKLVARFGSLCSAADQRLLHAEISAAASTLSTIGVARAHFWELDDSNGSLLTRLADGTTATLNPYQTELLLDFSRDPIQAFGAGNMDMLQNPPSVCTWLPKHPAYHAVRKIAMHGYTGRLNYGADEDREGNAQVVIHAVQVTCRYSDSPRYGKPLGILLVTEAADASLPFAAGSAGMGAHHLLKLRRFLVLQLLQKLALVVENKMNVFEAAIQHAELVRFIEETRSMLGEKEMDLSHKDGVIAARDDVLRAKDVHTLCSDALVACATLLGESQFRTAVIASAVAKSGCIRDKAEHHLSHCWLLVRATDYASSGTGHYPAESSSVCVISGYVHDGGSSVHTVSGQNKLVTRLLHGDYTSHSAMTVTSTLRDLQEAGFAVAPLKHSIASSAQSHGYSLVSVSQQVKLVDRLAFDCPGQCTAQVAVVIAVPEGASTELYASHAVSLAHIAQRAFTSQQSQYESALRQSLLSIPNALYDAVTTVKPIPVSDSYSPQKSHRGGAVAPPAPVPMLPHYHRALLSLLSTVNSAEVAAKFTVRKAAALVSDACASHWRLCEHPAESRKLAFLHVVGDKLQSIACPTVDLSVTSWLQDLYSGKIVFYDSVDHYASTPVMPEAYNVDQSLRGSVSRQSKLASPPYWEAQQLLRTVVHAVDPHVVNCALVPIRTSSGLSVLMLIDKLSTSAVGEYASASTRADVVPFSAPYMETLLATGVCKDLTQAMVIIQQQSAAFWAERELSEDIAALEQREENLCAVVAGIRQRAVVTAMFGRWKHAAKQSVGRLSLSKYQGMLSAVHALITHRARADSATDCARSFHSALESQFRTLFPLDSVSITENASPSAASTVTQLSEDSTHWTLHRDIVSTQTDPHGSVPNHHHHGSAGAAAGKTVRRSVAAVRLSRPVQLNRPFSAAEVEDFDTFCTLAGEVYTALVRGHRNDYAAGDVRSLVFPLLQELVPTLLAAASGDRGIQGVLPLLVDWMKRSCDASMVVLRLRPSADGDSETLLSSEETEESQLRSARESIVDLREYLELQTAGTSESTGSGVDNIILRFLERSQDGDTSTLGELKVLSSNKKHFSAEQSVVTQVLSMLLSFAVRNAETISQSSAREAKLRAERQQLHQALSVAKQGIEAETQSTEAFKARLASILSTIMFTDKLAATTTVVDLAALVCDGIPRLVGVNSAVLLLADTSHESGKAHTDHFRVMLPRSAPPPSSTDASSSIMSLAQIKQIPPMFDSAASSQCRIDLLSPADGALFGSILLFRTPSSGAGDHSPAVKENNTATYALWEGLEDILRSALSAAIFQCRARIAAAEHVHELDRALHKANAVLRDQAHLEPDVANLLSIKSDLEDQRDALQQEVTALKATVDKTLHDKRTHLTALEKEIEAIKARSHQSAAENAQEIEALEATLTEQREAHSKLSLSKKRLLELIASFSFDQRCEQETILQWLREVAESSHVALKLVAQSDGGILTGADGIRGLVAAVGEAVRTGMTVEFTTAGHASDQHGVDCGGSSAVRYTRSDGSSADVLQMLNFGNGLHGAKSGRHRSFLHPSDKSAENQGHFAVLCVPNRCAAAHSNTEHACFVFVKPVHGADGNFSADEKELLNSAANLSCRTLVHTAAQESEKEFRRLQSALQRSQVVEDNLRRVLALGEVLQQREYQTRHEISVVVDLGVRELLSRGDFDVCVTHTAMWFPPWNAAADQPSGVVSLRPVSSNADQDALARVLSTGQRVRRRSICWLPLLGHRGEILSILRVERTFSDTAEQIESPVSSIDGESQLPTVAHLAISDLEEDVLALYAAQAVPLLERMEFIGDAYTGVQQAGQAILALQAVKEGLEDKYSLEVAHRLQLEESLKAGAEMLGMTHSNRVGTGHLMDATRKSILTFTSSVDCFIIMPTVPEGEMDTHPSANGAEYCTFTSDLPREIAVVFDAGDLEAAAMQNFRSIKSAGGTQMPGMNGISTAGARAWQSWAVRRIQSQNSYNIDTEDGSLQEAEDDAELFTLAVPFALRSGAVAVISVVRRTAPFSSADRECITWVSKVLAYCLEVKGGEETMVETLQHVKILQGELVQLQEINEKLTAVEESAEALEQSLSVARPVPTLLKDLNADSSAATVPAAKLEAAAVDAVASAARAAFGQKYVQDAWADAASPEGWNQKLKTLPKAVVNSETGHVVYWIDSGSASDDSSTGSVSGEGKEGETRRQLRKKQEALFAAEQDEPKHPSMFLCVHTSGQPNVWVEVALDSKLVPHLKLRLAMLMQVVRSSEPLRAKLVEVHSALCDTHRARAEEQSAHAQSLYQKEAEIEMMKTSFVVNLGGTKDKYKTIVTEKSANYRKAERIFTETLVRTQSLRHLKMDVNASAETLRAAVLDALYQFGLVAQSGTGLQISVGECANSAAQGGRSPKATVSSSIFAEPKATAKTSRSSLGSLQGMQVDGVQWLGEAAVKPRDAMYALSQPQHAPIHVELYGGAAHTNPLQIALATGKTILFLPEGAGGDSPSDSGPVASVRESLLSICRKLSADSAGSVCLNPTSQFPLYSVIVPIVLADLESTVLVVVRPLAESPTAEDVSKYVLYSVLAGFLCTRQASLEILRQHTQRAAVSSKCKKLALQGMKRAFLATESAHITQALVFEKLRTAHLAAKLEAASVLPPQLSAARSQVRHLEQLNADWTEMVKGMTGASGGIQTGVAGLWAQACPTLMDLLSSHVTLQSCGLIVPSDSSITGGNSPGGVVEYKVRELTTPLPNQGRPRRTPAFSPVTVGEMEDYSRGSLEVRPASDLGSNVHALVQDILAGRTGAQRVFKMTRGRTSSGEDEVCLLLVPIRTARAVLGVLRVSVDLRQSAASVASGVTVADGAQTPGKAQSQRAEGNTRQEADVLEAAQSNVINFAEVLAPLHYAAQQLDRAKQSNARLDDAAQQSNSQAKALSQELAAATKKMSMLAGAARSIGVLSRSELTLPFTAPEECLRIFCNRVAIELSQQLGGRVIIHIQRNILSNAPSTDSATELNLSTKGAATVKGTEGDSVVTEALVDAQGKAFGSVSFHAERDNSTAPADGTVRKLYTAGKTTAPLEHVSYVLQSLSLALSGLLLRTAREISMKAEVASTQETVAALEGALEREQESVVQIQQVQEEHVVSNDFYRGLAEVLNQCLVYCSSEQEDRFKYPGNGESHTFARCVVLQETLSSLSAKLPALVGNGCSFNFALLDSKAPVSSDRDGEGRGRSGKNVTWVHPSSEETSRALDWHNIPQDTREIVMNLAHTCIAKRAKSTCEIGVNFSAHMSEDASSVIRLSAVRVISLPLVDQNTSAVLGVVQCLVEPAMLRPMIENLCEDVANCVACVLSVEVHQQRLCAKTQVQKLDLLTMDMKCNEVLQLKEMWQQRSRAWNALCLLASALTRASVGEERFVDILGSEAVVSLLCDAGVRVAVRPGSVADARRQILGAGSGSILAHAVIPITDTGDLVAEVICEKPSLVGTAPNLASLEENTGVATIAAELVETVVEILRGALAVHRIRQVEKAEISKFSTSAVAKIEKLKGEVKSAKEKLHIASSEAARLAQEAQQQSGKYEQMKASTISAVRNVCGTSVGTIAAQIEDMCAAMSADSSDASLASDLQELLRSVSALRTSTTSLPGGKGFGEAKQPEPWGTSAENDPEQVASAVMRPVTEMVTALRSALERVSVLQKQHAEQQRVNADKKSAVQLLVQQTQMPAQAQQKHESDAQEQEELRRQREERIAEMTQQVEHSLQQLSRTRKVHRVVCREASILLDPPYNPAALRGEQNTAHPASLTPLAASQDCCLKLLGMVRTLLRSEGQALLLRDPGTDPVTYQVIYTGDSLHWAGIGQGTFGVVSSSEGFVSANGTVRTSLAETAMHTHKSLQSSNAPMDSRYNAYIDGICDLGTPILVIPMRGRGGAVVGVLIASRGKGAAPFSADDIVAAEICSALGALSLYWCQGLGALHHQIAQSSSRAARLERLVDKLQEKTE